MPRLVTFLSNALFTDTGKAHGQPRRSLKTDAKKAPGCGERIAACAVPASRSTHGGSIWTDAVKMAIYGVRLMMEYWANILGMAGAACIAVAFIDGSSYAFMCGLLMAYTGYRLWRAK